MSRRGPDDAGQWISADSRVAFVHRRLAIIDLSDAGHQPMATEDGRFHITYNGEIYNYRALKSELEAKGYGFRSSSDTEVLLRLYEDRGERMVEALRGMFAFAIWDDFRKTLFLARDHFGIKPLYLADDGRTLRFASQVKALLSTGICTTPDLAGYAGFMTWGYVPDPYTLHREIRSIAAGSTLTIAMDGTRREVAYFSISETLASARRMPADPNSAAETAVMALKESVAHHMIADVPVAAFLSAGLDSSMIVALASAAPGGNLRTLTLGFKEYANTERDETRLAALTASRFGASHETRWVSEQQFVADLLEIFAAMDQPSTDGVNTYLVSKAAASAGMKVALSGLGGDELFGGYPSFADVPRITRFASLLGISPGLGRRLRRFAAPLAAQITSPKYAGLLEYGHDRSGAYLLRRGLFMPWELSDELGHAIAHEGLEQLRALPQLARSIEGIDTDRAAVCALEMQWYMKGQLLRDSDWAGMANSVEIRVPFIDLEMFRAVAPLLAAGIPLSKVQVAAAVEPRLPLELLSRGKTGFEVPVRKWAQRMSAAAPRDRGLRSWSREILSQFAADSFLAPPVQHGERRARSRFIKKIQASVVARIYLVTNAILKMAATLMWPGTMPQRPRKICIFRIGNIGDVICALPAMRAVRRAYPESHITLLTSPGPRGMPGATDVMKGIDWIDSIRTYYQDDINSLKKRAGFLKEIRAESFDMWIDLPNNLTTLSRQLRDMVFARLAAARWARGWRIDTIRWAAQAQSEYLEFPNEVDRMLRLVADAGFDISAPDFGLARLKATQSRIDDMFTELNLVDRSIVAIAPGAKRLTNRWVDDRFAEVGRELACLGHAIVFLGGTSEAEVCAQLKAQVGGDAFSLAGKLSISESCEVLRRSELVVCLDSGIQHMASAVGTRALSLFSFWQMRGKWRPYGISNTVIQKWVPCHTCLRDVCPFDNRCMKEIRAGDVTRHAKEMLRHGLTTESGKRSQAEAY